MQMTKFQHKFYALSLALMELIPLPDQEEDFSAPYSTQMIMWKYMLGCSLRAETSFPINAEMHLENHTYQDSREKISITLLEEIVEIQRVFFLLISEQNDGVTGFTDVILRHWVGLMEELVESNEASTVVKIAAQSFDKLLTLHRDLNEHFSLNGIKSYPFDNAITEKSPAELAEDLQAIRGLIQSDQH